MKFSLLHACMHAYTFKPIRLVGEIMQKTIGNDVLFYTLMQFDIVLHSWYLALVRK